MVTSDNERDWHSHSLADEDEEVQYLSENLFVPTQTKTEVHTSREEFRSKMQGLDMLPPAKADKIFELAWKYKEVFEPVKPGKITKYFHEIITTTDRPTMSERIH